ncbi:rodlin [Streptomyces mauvecolor]
MQKLWSTAAVAAVVSGVAMTAAPQAMAVGDHGGTKTLSGNGAQQAFGNSRTDGDMAPQMTLVQGSLNKPCLGVPVKANFASVVGFVPVSVLQDVPVLSAPQNQQCTENSAQVKGDEPLSHILDEIPIRSGNGRG